MIFLSAKTITFHLVCLRNKMYLTLWPICAQLRRVQATIFLSSKFMPMWRIKAWILLNKLVVSILTFFSLATRLRALEEDNRTLTLAVRSFSEDIVKLRPNTGIQVIIDVPFISRFNPDSMIRKKAVLLRVRVKSSHLRTVPELHQASLAKQVKKSPARAHQAWSLRKVQLLSMLLRKTRQMDQAIPKSA